MSSLIRLVSQIEVVAIAIMIPKIVNHGVVWVFVSSHLPPKANTTNGSAIINPSSIARLTNPHFFMFLSSTNIGFFPPKFHFGA